MNLEEIENRAKYERNNIIQHREGPAIVIAGPGTGKTTTLAERLVSLCQENKYNHTSITAVTFTNTAAERMKKKVKEICEKLNYEPDSLHISTMHSLAKGLLHRYSTKLGLSPSFRVVANELQKRMIFEDIGYELKSQNVNLGRYKNKYLRRFEGRRALVPDSFLDNIAKIPFKEGFATQDQFDECYSSLLNYYRSVDWYGVVALAVKLLQENKDILNNVACEMGHLLVDEYQDLNRADHELIHLLSTKAKSLMVFADDDQSIYQTGRFAHPEGVKRFKENYPNAKIYPLSVCWRCGESIINAAWKLVDVDENLLTERMVKEKPIPHPAMGPGEFKISGFKSDKAEIEGICDEVKQELNKIPPPENIFILFHSRNIGKEYGERFQTLKQANGIQFENLLSKSQTDSKEVLLFYETLRLINDESDNLAARFLLREFFKMPAKQIAKIRSISRNRNKLLWQAAIEANDTTDIIKSWSENLKRWRKMEKEAFIEMLNDIIRTLEINTCPEIIEILTWCNKEKNLTIPKLISRLEKRVDFDEFALEEALGDRVTRVVIMTMHGAKGLNADAVFVPALEDQLIPNKWYEPEQRRLLYVSMTRAKRRLFLSWAWSRTGRDTFRSIDRDVIGRKRSKFLDEIESVSGKNLIRH